MPQSSYPQHPIIRDMLSVLDVKQRELYEERAGILEYDAGLERPLAEAVALLEIIRRIGWPPIAQKWIAPT